MPSPIRKVLSSMQTHRVRALLMGGQACVFYGAAEFSRDVDFAIHADAANLTRLRHVIGDLQAHPIAVPPFELKFLGRGHAIHFRCQHPDALRLRVDVMSKMRGTDPFSTLWKRRTVIELPDGTRCNLMSLSDLVQAKKTQRDKDWPMIRRLVEAHYFENNQDPTAAQIHFWLMQLRTPEILIELAGNHVSLCRRLKVSRPTLGDALQGDRKSVERGLLAEEAKERERDRQYWMPLRKELEALRRITLKTSRGHIDQIDE